MTLLTIKDLAARWKVHKLTIHRWMKAGDLPHMKIGGSIRFTEQMIEEFEERGLTQEEI